MKIEDARRSIEIINRELEKLERAAEGSEQVHHTMGLDLTSVSGFMESIKSDEFKSNLKHARRRLAFYTDEAKLRFDLGLKQAETFTRENPRRAMAMFISFGWLMGAFGGMFKKRCKGCK